jgi:hypothetical protein
MRASGVKSWLAAVTLVLWLAACGGEKTFSSDEFVDAMHDNGVELEVGQRLFSDDAGKEVYDVSLEPLPGAPSPKQGALETPHGAMTIHDDVSGADDQLRSCEEAGDELLCFQAANVVVVMEGGGLEAARLAAAMKKLEE